MSQNQTRATKQLLLTEIIERYPRMLKLLKAATIKLGHDHQTWAPTDEPYDKCVLCQIEKLLTETESDK